MDEGRSSVQGRGGREVLVVSTEGGTAPGIGAVRLFGE